MATRNSIKDVLGEAFWEKITVAPGKSDTVNDDIWDICVVGVAFREKTGERVRDADEVPLRDAAEKGVARNGGIYITAGFPLGNGGDYTMGLTQAWDCGAWWNTRWNTRPQSAEWFSGYLEGLSLRDDWFEAEEVELQKRASGFYATGENLGAEAE